MSKELEALERIKSICKNYECGFTVIKNNKKSHKLLEQDLEIIEECVKYRQESINIINQYGEYATKYEILKDAISIIKEKGTLFFVDDDGNRNLTKEEDELLQEVLL